MTLAVLGSSLTAAQAGPVAGGKPSVTGKVGADLLVEVFGDAGRHARSAVGASELPLDIPVEIELIVEIAPEPTGR